MVQPFSKHTWAARSSVHRLVALPALRGDWCSRERRSSSRALGPAAWIVLGRFDLGRVQPIPAAEKARRALRTAWEEPPKAAAIWAGRWPLSLASRTWQRRRVKASAERSPSRRADRSGSDRGRTKRGGFMPHSTRPMPSHTVPLCSALAADRRCLGCPPRHRGVPSCRAGFPER